MDKVIDNIKINYSSTGDGDTLAVILHGWGCNGSLYEKAAATLSQKFTCVVPDLPGFGESGKLPRPFSVDDYTDIIIKFIASFGFRKVVIVAHSFGGRILLKMFSRKIADFEITAVVLTGCAGIKPKQSFKKRVSLRFYKLGKAFLSLPPLKAMFPNAIPNWRKKRGSADYNSADETMRQTLVKTVNEDLTDCIKNISAPTLLFWGELDDATPLADGELMEKLIPDAGLVKAAGCGHYAFLENSELFSRVLKSFFKINI